MVSEILSSEINARIPDAGINLAGEPDVLKKEKLDPRLNATSFGAISMAKRIR